MFSNKVHGYSQRSRSRFNDVFAEQQERWPSDRPRFLPQTYETTVLHPDKDTSLGWRFLVIPARSLQEDRVEVETVIDKLELTKQRAISVSMLPYVMASILLDIEPDDVFSSALSLFGNQSQVFLDETLDALRFAEQLAFQRLVPFEQSPLSSESLAAIASPGEEDASDITLVRQGDKSLVLVTNAAGIVISAPAHGFLSNSILEKIFDWLRGK